MSRRRVQPLVVRLHDLALTLACAVCAWLVLLVSDVRAQPLQAVLRVVDADDAPLLQRIQGQLSDLPVVLVSRSDARLETGLRAQLTAARALAVREAARVVIWTTRSPSQLTVMVADLASERVLVRALPRGASESDRSAQEEAAALVVRSALKASLAGEALGSREAELPPEAAAPTPAAATVRAEHVEEHVQARGTVVRGWLALGAVAAADGISARGQAALGARAALRLGAIELGLRGALGLPVRVESALADVKLAQHRLALYAGVALHESERLRWTLLAHAGLLLASTRVHSAQDLFVARSGQSALATLGLGTSLLFTPRWAQGRLALAGSAAVEALPERLALVYQSAGGAMQVARAWPLQPLFSLELVLPLRR